MTVGVHACNSEAIDLSDLQLMVPTFVVSDRLVRAIAWVSEFVLCGILWRREIPAIFTTEMCSNSPSILYFFVSGWNLGQWSLAFPKIPKACM